METLRSFAPRVLRSADYGLTHEEFITVMGLAPMPRCAASNYDDDIKQAARTARVKALKLFTWHAKRVKFMNSCRR